jgi:hypothetical protein
MSRDGATCVWCGRGAWRADLTVEHLLPKTRGGRGIPENLAVACRRCNRRRGAKPVVAYVRDRLEAGDKPEIEQLCVLLERLSASGSRPHAEYGSRQRALLGRIADAGSADDGGFPGQALGVELG